jgi:hypothetical protein
MVVLKALPSSFFTFLSRYVNHSEITGGYSLRSFIFSSTSNHQHASDAMKEYVLRVLYNCANHYLVCH